MLRELQQQYLSSFPTYYNIYFLLLSSKSFHSGVAIQRQKHSSAKPLLVHHSSVRQSNVKRNLRLHLSYFCERRVHSSHPLTRYYLAFLDAIQPGLLKRPTRIETVKERNPFGPSFAKILKSPALALFDDICYLFTLQEVPE